ncbi:MAG: hypothetical protein ACTHNL_18185 [Devosia sp.]|jgi:hypothetical protein
MNKLVLVAVAALTAGAFGVGASYAQAGGDFAKADANHDGAVDMAEAQGVFPNLTQDIFNKADANGDGKLDEAEYGNLQGLAGGLGDTTGGSSSSSAEASSSSSTSGG